MLNEGRALCVSSVNRIFLLYMQLTQGCWENLITNRHINTFIGSRLWRSVILTLQGNHPFISPSVESFVLFCLQDYTITTGFPRNFGGCELFQGRTHCPVGGMYWTHTDLMDILDVWTSVQSNQYKVYQSASLRYAFILKVLKRACYCLNPAAFYLNILNIPEIKFSKHTHIKYALFFSSFFGKEMELC